MTDKDKPPLQIDVVSDVMCPWCYIGKRRLETAIADAELALDIRWRPFQLDPTLPPGGKDRKIYLAEKFEFRRKYSEREVNDILNQWALFNDWALLRRELIMYNLLQREKNGSAYWRVDDDENE